MHRIVLIALLPLLAGCSPNAGKSSSEQFVNEMTRQGYEVKTIATYSDIANPFTWFSNDYAFIEARKKLPVQIPTWHVLNYRYDPESSKPEIWQSFFRFDCERRRYQEVSEHTYKDLLKTQGNYDPLGGKLPEDLSGAVSPEDVKRILLVAPVISPDERGVYPALADARKRILERFCMSR